MTSGRQRARTRYDETQSTRTTTLPSTPRTTSCTSSGRLGGPGPVQQHSRQHTRGGSLASLSDTHDPCWARTSAGTSSARSFRRWLLVGTDVPYYWSPSSRRPAAHRRSGHMDFYPGSGRLGALDPMIASDVCAGWPGTSESAARGRHRCVELPEGGRGAARWVDVEGDGGWGGEGLPGWWRAELPIPSPSRGDGSILLHGDWERCRRADSEASRAVPAPVGRPSESLPESRRCRRLSRAPRLLRADSLRLFIRGLLDDFRFFRVRRKSLAGRWGDGNDMESNRCAVWSYGRGRGDVIHGWVARASATDQDSLIEAGDLMLRDNSFAGSEPRSSRVDPNAWILMYLRTRSGLYSRPSKTPSSACDDNSALSIFECFLHSDNFHYIFEICILVLVIYIFEIHCLGYCTKVQSEEDRGGNNFGFKLTRNPSEKHIRSMMAHILLHNKVHH